MSNLSSNYHTRLLTELSNNDITTIIIVIFGILMVLLAIGCYCWRKKQPQRIQFQVFTNQQTAPTSKQSKVNMTGTDHVINFGKESSYIKDGEQLLSTSQSKKRRRRKKDRLQQHSTELEQEDAPRTEEQVERKKQPEQTFDIE